VHLWHGEADINVPIAMARFVADQIPNCQVRTFAGEGHFSMLLKHEDEVLQILAGG
jgi:pimeloyl-ACP methyl ester carboxylesterase